MRRQSTSWQPSAEVSRQIDGTAYDNILRLLAYLDSGGVFPAGLATIKGLPSGAIEDDIPIYKGTAWTLIQRSLLGGTGTGTAADISALVV